jgi:uncharacterized membrane protein
MVNSAILPVHVLAGILALVFGYVALFAAKGAPLHRKAGVFFVYAMVVMALGGALIAAIDPHGSPINVAAGLVTFYLVLTARRTVRRQWRPGSIDVALAAAAFLFGLLALRASMGGGPTAPPSVVFGIVAILGGIGDVRVIRAGGIQGSDRMTRHIWRMCFAMVVAAGSFFLGPRGRVPEIIYVPSLLPIPVLVPVVVMLFWLWRLRVRKSFRGIVGLTARANAAVEQS